MALRAFVVANPTGGSGKVRKDWELIERLIKMQIPEYDFAFTEGPGHATLLTREALRAGWEMVISVGGDGTNNEVMNGFFEKVDTKAHYRLDHDGFVSRINPDVPTFEAINPDARLGFIPMGTGGDFRRSTGLMGTLAENMKRLSGTDSRQCDLGLLTYIATKGQLESRFYLNVASAGIGGVVDKTSNKMWKGLGGTASFMVASTVSWIGYQNQHICARIDDIEEIEDKFFNFVVANGQYFGGGMWVAPGAQIDDGKFQVVRMGNLTKAESLSLSTKIHKGQHLELEAVTRGDAHTVSMRTNSRTEVLLDVDGEQPGRLPALFEMCPSAITLKI